MKLDLTDREVQVLKAVFTTQNVQEKRKYSNFHEALAGIQDKIHDNEEAEAKLSEVTTIRDSIDEIRNDQAVLSEILNRHYNLINRLSGKVDNIAMRIGLKL